MNEKKKNYWNLTVYHAEFIIFWRKIVRYKCTCILSLHYGKIKNKQKYSFNHLTTYVVIVIEIKIIRFCVVNLKFHEYIIQIQTILLLYNKLQLFLEESTIGKNINLFVRFVYLYFIICRVTTYTHIVCICGK